MSNDKELRDKKGPSNMKEELKELIGQTIGQASMQWEKPFDGGVYQSNDATKLLEEVYDKILALVKEDYVRLDRIEVCPECLGIKHEYKDSYCRGIQACSHCNGKGFIIREEVQDDKSK